MITSCWWWICAINSEATLVDSHVSIFAFMLCWKSWFCICGGKCGPPSWPTHWQCVVPCADVSLYGAVMLVVDLVDQFGNSIDWIIRLHLRFCFLLVKLTMFAFMVSNVDRPMEQHLDISAFLWNGRVGGGFGRSIWNQNRVNHTLLCLSRVGCANWGLLWHGHVYCAFWSSICRRIMLNHAFSC